MTITAFALRTGGEVWLSFKKYSSGIGCLYGRLVSWNWFAIRSQEVAWPYPSCETLRRKWSPIYWLRSMNGYERKSSRQTRMPRDRSTYRIGVIIFGQRNSEEGWKRPRCKFAYWSIGKPTSCQGQATGLPSIQIYTFRATLLQPHQTANSTIIKKTSFRSFLHRN